MPSQVFLSLFLYGFARIKKVQVLPLCAGERLASKNHLGNSHIKFKALGKYLLTYNAKLTYKQLRDKQLVAVWRHSVTIRG